MNLLVISSCLIGCNNQLVKNYHPETNYDSQIVVDLNDDLSDEDIAKFAEEYNLILHPTSLFAETKEEIADIGDKNEEQLLAVLQNDLRVEIAEPLTEFHINSLPNDPLYKDQWGMEKLNAPTAWNYTTGRGVIIAVIDTGIACYNRDGFTKMTDLEAECVDGWNVVGNNDLAADDNSHGSHVASTIAETANNGIGGVGLAYHAKIMPVKVLDADGSGSNAGVADGIRWSADHGAQVINMSLGGPNSAVMQKAITYAISKGVTVIAAAGNSSGQVEYPGASKGVIGVSATDPTDALAKFSCRGNGVDIAGPGVNVLQQTICSDGKDNCFEYKSYSGTSMASPMVSGVATLVESLGITEPKAVEAVLVKTARKVDDSAAGKNLYGAGIVDAGAAVRFAVLSHALTRILALLGLTFLVAFWSKRKNASATSPWTPNFLVPAFLCGVGLFFLPFVIPCVALPLDLASRAIADMDLVAGLAFHKWLPLANFFIPAFLMTLLFGVKKARPIVGGVAIGMAAYLASVMYLGDQLAPMGSMLQGIWCSANIIGLAWIGKKNLAESK